MSLCRIARPALPTGGVGVPVGAPERRPELTWGCACACPCASASPCLCHAFVRRRATHRRKNHGRPEHHQLHFEPPHRHQGCRLEHPRDHRGRSRSARRRIEQRNPSASPAGARRWVATVLTPPTAGRSSSATTLPRTSVAPLGRGRPQDHLLGAGALLPHALSERRLPVTRLEDPGAARGPGSCDGSPHASTSRNAGAVLSTRAEAPCTVRVCTGPHTCSVGSKHANE